jgi:hypothetical protein
LHGNTGDLSGTFSIGVFLCFGSGQLRGAQLE